MYAYRRHYVEGEHSWLLDFLERFCWFSFQNYLIALINTIFVIFIIVAKKPKKSLTKKKLQKEFDPDQFVLTKQKILEFCDGVLEKWEKKPKENAQNIFAMNAVRMSVQWTDEEPLKAIWDEILKWAFVLTYKNAISQAKEENIDCSPQT